MLEAGKSAPDFTLPDQDGNEVTLSKLRGEAVVLYFYPRADTPGCTTQACGVPTQACGVRDRSGEYATAGARVIGVSPDEPEALKKFAGKYDLGFTLLGDADHAVADAYGAWGEKSMYGKKYMGMLRSTFIIDADGKIARVFPKVQPKSTTTSCSRPSPSSQRPERLRRVGGVTRWRAISPQTRCTVRSATPPRSGVTRWCPDRTPTRYTDSDATRRVVSPFLSAPGCEWQGRREAGKGSALQCVIRRRPTEDAARRCLVRSGQA